MAWHHRLIGKAARLYWRMRKPRTLGVRALVFDQEGRIALVRHTYIDAWYLPGGGVKKGEGFEGAVRRELREEVGIIDVRIERVLGVYHSSKEAKDDNIVVFVTRTGSSPLRKADSLEIEEARWFPLDALPPNVSDATRRRIDEYRNGGLGLGNW